MIGNGRRGAGERDRDLEEDDELESREERSSESGGGGGGGFGGWRSHLLGGLTQRVKSWYWGARPLVSFPIQKDTISLSLSFSFPLFTHARFYLSFLFFFSCRFFRLMLSVVRRHFALSCGRIRGQGHLEKGRKMYRKKNPTSFDQKLNSEKLFSISYFSKYIIWDIFILILFNFLFFIYLIFNRIIEICINFAWIWSSIIICYFTSLWNFICINLFSPKFLFVYYIFLFQFKFLIWILIFNIKL